MYKVPKGTKDLAGLQYKECKALIDRIETEFIKAGGEPLDTPVFERTDVLLGKYGEEADTKLIYRLAEEGGESLALRYDLTVPFVRHVKENGVRQMRRYSIGKVYRRDQPSINTGRYREFIQADFDIYGERQEGMLAEITVLNTVCRVFDSLGLEYTILLNDVRNLKYMLQEVVGVDQWRPICTIIDKLDKCLFESLVTEFESAGLTAAQIAVLKQQLEMTEPLFEDTQKDYRTLASYADILGIGSRLRFTSSLARGLDYYTGFIWEFKLNGIQSTVSAGGRYDGLLGAPAVGVSIGVSRILSYIPRTSEPGWQEVYYVAGVGNISMEDRMRVIYFLQQKGYNVQYGLGVKDKKLGKILSDCATDKLRYLAIIGENELKEGYICIKDLKEETQTNVYLS